jgi:hypothetical protein
VTRPQAGTYKVIVPGGGSCRRWVDFESSPGDATTAWHAGTGAVWVDTYMHAVSFQTDRAFTLYLSC